MQPEEDRHPGLGEFVIATRHEAARQRADEVKQLVRLVVACSFAGTERAQLEVGSRWGQGLEVLDKIIV